MNIAAHIFVMAAVTYLIRMLPFALSKGRIKSPFVRRTLDFLPYGVLSAMTFPGIFSSTGSTASAAAGTAAAVIMAYFKLPLIAVALGSAAVAYVSAFALGG